MITQTKSHHVFSRFIKRMFYVRSSMNETVVLLKLDENVLILDQKHLSFFMLPHALLYLIIEKCVLLIIFNLECERHRGRSYSPSFSFIFFNGEKRIKWWSEVCLQRYFYSFHNSHLHCHKNSFQHFLFICFRFMKKWMKKNPL